MRSAHRLFVLGAVVLATAACSGSSEPADDAAVTSTEASETTDPGIEPPGSTLPTTTSAADATVADTTVADTTVADTAVVLPGGTEAGLDDVDGDGEPDPTCGTTDLGGGLVVRLLCTPMSPENEDGVLPIEPGPLSLAGTSFPETDTVDVTVRWGRTATGERVTIFQLGSDTLFDAGSATVRTTAEPALAGAAAAITANLPGATVVVRGHADSRGSAADNQALSQARADAVAAVLTGLGIDPAAVTAIGLGSTVPAAHETTPDGSVSEIGQALNRRVEIVVLTP